MIQKSKRKAHEYFRIQQSGHNKKDKRIYWKKVKDEWERGTNVSSEGNEVKYVNGKDVERERDCERKVIGIL